MQFLGRSGPDSVGTRWKEQGSSQCGERTPTIGHITGFQNFEPAIAGKFVGLLKEAAPNVSRVAVLLNPDTAVHVALLQAAEAVASSLGIQVAAVGVRDGTQIARGIASFANCIEFRESSFETSTRAHARVMGSYSPGHSNLVHVRSKCKPPVQMPCSIAQAPMHCCPQLAASSRVASG
jgi:hypothetical protein